MSRRTNSTHFRRSQSVSHPDSGVTFIELLVAVVLLGTGVIAVVIGLQAATTASVIDAEHAQAFAVLHDASDVVFDAERLSCENGEAALVAAYGAGLASQVEYPDGWSVANVEIIKIEFLLAQEVDGRTTFTWSTSCSEGVQGSIDYTDVPLRSQKVTIRVTTPDGIVKTLDTVKG